MGIGGGEAAGAPVVDAGHVRDGHVQQDEGGGGVVDQLVSGGEELAIVELVKVGGVWCEAVPGHRFQHVQHGTFGIRDSALTGVHAAAQLAVAGPEAVVEHVGEDAAVGVPPACDCGFVASVEGVLKDGLASGKGMPCSVGGTPDQQRKAGCGGSHSVEGLSGHEGGEDDVGPIAGGHGVGEDG